eukprot:4130654-Prymnesium_polylepis.1
MRELPGRRHRDAVDERAGLEPDEAAARADLGLGVGDWRRVEGELERRRQQVVVVGVPLHRLARELGDEVPLVEDEGVGDPLAARLLRDRRHRVIELDRQRARALRDRRVQVDVDRRRRVRQLGDDARREGLEDVRRLRGRLALEAAQPRRHRRQPAAIDGVVVLAQHAHAVRLLRRARRARLARLARARLL